MALGMIEQRHLVGNRPVLRASSRSTISGRRRCPPISLAIARVFFSASRLRRSSAPRQLQRVFERGFDADVEPAVDAAMQKTQRKVVDHADRSMVSSTNTPIMRAVSCDPTAFSRILHDQPVDVVDDQAEQQRPARRR